MRAAYVPSLFIVLMGCSSTTENRTSSGGAGGASSGGSGNSGGGGGSGGTGAVGGSGGVAGGGGTGAVSGAGGGGGTAASDGGVPDCPGLQIFGKSVFYCVPSTYTCAQFDFRCGATEEKNVQGDFQSACTGGMIFKADYTCSGLTQVTVRGWDCNVSFQDLATCIVPK